MNPETLEEAIKLAKDIGDAGVKSHFFAPVVFPPKKNEFLLRASSLSFMLRARARSLSFSLSLSHTHTLSLGIFTAKKPSLSQTALTKKKNTH